MTRQQELEAMSDGELSATLALLLGNNATEPYTTGAVVNNVFYVDYCNNPSDIMPLAKENGISLISLNKSTGKEYLGPSGKWQAEALQEGYFSQSENPYRAASIILMKESDL